MKTTIYYFSSTGNSLIVARELAEKLGETVVSSIPKTINQELDLSADRIGIVFPVYIWGMPVIVSKFLKKFKNIKDKYIFAVATYGGFPAGTLLQVEKQLKEQGSKLNAGFGVRMPGNYTPMYGAISEKKQLSMFKNKNSKTEEIVKSINNRIEKIEKNFFLTNLLFSSVIYKLSIKNINNMDKQFWVTDRCNSCGICVKVCPVNNINLIEGKPVWQHKCEHCLGCLQWCPKEAIQFGKSTAKRKRYHHPDIKVQDFMNCVISFTYSKKQSIKAQY